MKRPRRWRWVGGLFAVLFWAGWIIPAQGTQAHDEAGPPDRGAVGRAVQGAGQAQAWPFGLDLRRDMNPGLQMAIIIAATFVWEDPTSIAVGLLIRAGQLNPVVGVAAIFIGIFLGDMGLYLIGRSAGRRALKWRPIAQRLPVHQIDALGRWFDRHGWTAVLLSRFVPGMRFPVYVSAGVLGNQPGRFLLWTLGAVAIWAPTILFIVIVLGEATSPLGALLGSGWLALIVVIGLILIVLRVLTMSFTAIGRAKLLAAVGRWRHHEFWPAWVFYLPLVPYVAWLCLKHRSFMCWTAVNPAIPHGGVVGESKWHILSQLPREWVQPTLLLSHQQSAMCRQQVLREHVEREGWPLPLILKPDAGQRGAGVRKVHTWDQAAQYLEQNPVDVIAQPYHAGPLELGIFYYRFPQEREGHILAVTDKVFSVLEGDGKHTLEMLIWRHPRYRKQAKVFLRRFEDELDRVPEKGERIALGVAGNHCQGALFRDGAHLVTDDLRRRIDQIAQTFAGFYFGRFDVRYSDLRQLQRGEGFAILELNGATSEATSLYDPSWSALQAYRLLFKQWRIMYAIGARNQQRGAAVIGVIPLLKMVRRFYRERRGQLNAD
jgi:membrane protein DedA with SNARE-associated domain